MKTLENLKKTIKANASPVSKHQKHNKKEKIDGNEVRVGEDKGGRRARTSKTSRFQERHTRRKPVLNLIDNLLDGKGGRLEPRKGGDETATVKSRPMTTHEVMAVQIETQQRRNNAWEAK